MLAALKKYLSKYILEVVPSVVATVVGAYIVTHYINAKNEEKPAAEISSKATPADAVKERPSQAKAEPAKVEPVKAAATDKSEPETRTASKPDA
jgi:hypothetical protein